MDEKDEKFSNIENRLKIKKKGEESYVKMGEKERKRKCGERERERGNVRKIQHRRSFPPTKVHALNNV